MMLRVVRTRTGWGVLVILAATRTYILVSILTRRAGRVRRGRSRCRG